MASAHFPIARASAEEGFFRDVRADDLSAQLLNALVKRTGLEPRLVEDVKWGCVQQQGEQGVDVARNAVLIAGWPVHVGGETINRNCASSLCAINNAAMSILAGCEDVQVAGGVEHMHHVPMTKDYNTSPALFRNHSSGIMHMGLTAEYLAVKTTSSGRSRMNLHCAATRTQPPPTLPGSFAMKSCP